MISSYFLEMHTGVDYTVDEYDAAAGRLANMIVALLSDRSKTDAITHESAVESFHSEIEVMLEEGELLARVVVDITAETPVKFDKGKWTKFLKSRPEFDEWKKMKIHKRLVSD